MTSRSSPMGGATCRRDGRVEGQKAYWKGGLDPQLDRWLVHLVQVTVEGCLWKRPGESFCRHPKQGVRGACWLYLRRERRYKFSHGPTLIVCLWKMISGIHFNETTPPTQPSTATNIPRTHLPFSATTRPPLVSITTKLSNCCLGCVTRSRLQPLQRRHTDKRHRQRLSACRCVARVF